MLLLELGNLAFLHLNEQSQEERKKQLIHESSSSVSNIFTCDNWEVFLLAYLKDKAINVFLWNKYWQVFCIQLVSLSEYFNYLMVITTCSSICAE